MAESPIIIDEKVAKRSLAALMARAHRGEEFIIARDGVPLARLVSNTRKPD